MDDTVMTVVGLSDIPATIRSHDTLASPDYVDVFTATASGATGISGAVLGRAGNRSPLYLIVLGGGAPQLRACRRHEAFDRPEDVAADRYYTFRHDHDGAGCEA